MNIFRLDNDPKVCAKYHCDRHLVKMPMEYMAFLTGFKHPLTTWAHESVENFTWLLDLSTAVCEEYLFRYGQLHWLAQRFTTINVPEYLVSNSPTEQPYIHESNLDRPTGDVVDCYRWLYCNVKFELCTWSFRLPPEWFSTECDPIRYYIGDKQTFQKLIGERYARGKSSF